MKKLIFGLLLCACISNATATTMATSTRNNDFFSGTVTDEFFDEFNCLSNDCGYEVGEVSRVTAGRRRGSVSNPIVSVTADADLFAPVPGSERPDNAPFATSEVSAMSVGSRNNNFLVNAFGTLSYRVDIDTLDGVFFDPTLMIPVNVDYVLRADIASNFGPTALNNISAATAQLSISVLDENSPIPLDFIRETARVTAASVSSAADFGGAGGSNSDENLGTLQFDVLEDSHFFVRLTSGSLLLGTQQIGDSQFFANASALADPVFSIDPSFQFASQLVINTTYPDIPAALLPGVGPATGIPTPASGWLMGIGLLGFIGARRRAKQAS